MHTHTHIHTHTDTHIIQELAALNKSGCDAMRYMASFPHSGETLRGDEVKQTESRDGMGKQAREREQQRE